MMTNRNTEEVLLVDADVCSVFGSEKRSCTLWTSLTRGKLEQYICVCDTYSDASWKNVEKPEEPRRTHSETQRKPRKSIQFEKSPSSETVYGPHFVSLFTVNRSQTHQNTRGTHVSPTFSPKKLEWVCESPFGVYKDIPSGCGWVVGVCVWGPWALIVLYI